MFEIRLLLCQGCRLLTRLVNLSHLKLYRGMLKSPHYLIMLTHLLTYSAQDGHALLPSYPGWLTLRTVRTYLSPGLHEQHRYQSALRPRTRLLSGGHSVAGGKPDVRTSRHSVITHGVPVR